MKKKTQSKVHVLLIHGGMTFKTHKDYLHFLRTRTIRVEKKLSWTGPYLDTALGKKFEIIRPRMPLQDNAKYDEWKILFERYLSALDKNFILIGWSLGGIFLAKYLSEHKLKQQALSTYLICPPFDDSIPTEDLVGGFKLTSDLSLLQTNSRNLHLMFSADDDVVPVAHAEKFRAKLPQAHIVVYKSKNGHFEIARFPELIRLIGRETRAV